MGDARFMWLRTNLGQFVAQRYENENPEPEEDEHDDPELGPTYVLILPRMSGRPVRFNLTSLTEEELTLTRQFFETLFDLALPVVRHRDKVAQHAADQGDDSYVRIYRQVPQFIERKGPLGQDDQRLLQRSWDLVVGAGTDGTLDGGLRGVGDELAPSESEEDRSQDDRPQADQP